MIATAEAEDFRRAIETIGDAGEVDAIIAIFVPPLVARPGEVAAAIAAAADQLAPERGVGHGLHG